MATSIDPERARELLEALGIEVMAENGDELSALCPMHKARTGKEDHNPSWWFNRESGQHVCFSCGYSGGVVGLVADVMGFTSKWGLVDVEKAKEWLQGFQLDLPELVRRLKPRDTYELREKATEMSDARLALYTAPPQWALDARGLTESACEAYQVLWDADEDAWITPLRNPDTKKLIGYQLKGQGHRLFRNRPAGIKKSTTMFGITTFEGGRMIIVESPLDAARIHSAGFEHQGVATCGARISERQIELMMRADEIVLAMDNPRLDSAGEHALEEFYKASRKRGIDFKQFSYGDLDAKDPGDMTDAQIRDGVENAVHSIYGIERLVNA